MKKLVRFLILLCCIVVTSHISYAETKKVIYSDITAYINGLPIPSYNFYGGTVVIAEELEKYGFELNYVNEERCLYIDYNPSKEITADYDPQKDNKKIGSVAFTVQATDIYTRVNGFNTTYGATSYSIDGQLIININELNRCKSSYVTWYQEERKICFDYVPYWEIIPDIDYQKEKTENISNFIVELTKREQKELDENGKEQQYFNLKGENEQYLSGFRMIWCGKTPVRDLSRNWFENGKITIDFSIREDDIFHTEPLMQLLNSILTINSEGNIVTENIAAANEHIKVSINEESVPISAIELRPNSNGYTYYIELDKEIKNLDEMQTIKIECK